jgi:hypothetical protein
MSDDEKFDLACSKVASWFISNDWSEQLVPGLSAQRKLMAIAYGLFEGLCYTPFSGEENEKWLDFLQEALQECINRESSQ